MSEMVERLSRAFADREGWVWDALHHLEDTSLGWGRNHIRQHIYENIRGMREPTDAMKRAYWDLLLDNEDGPHPAVAFRAMVDAALVSERGDRPMNRITVVIDSKELDDILRKHFASAFPGMEFESCDSPSYSNSLTEILVHLKRKDEGGAALGSERGAEK